MCALTNQSRLSIQKGGAGLKGTGAITELQYEKTDVSF